MYPHLLWSDVERPQESLEYLVRLAEDDRRHGEAEALGSGVRHPPHSAW